jgi:REP element-mobilizing transposase RayT
MTAPRQILAGATYLVTRRCSQRQFLLRPSETVNAIFLYVLALAARRFGIRVHAFCVLSNHFHAVVTDPDARLPAFEQYLDSLVARATNAFLGRWEDFWAPNSYSAVKLESAADIISKCAYTLANPVAAGLVSSSRDWPGLWTSPEQIGSVPIVARKPNVFFRKKGYLPEAVELELTVPAGWPVEEFRERLSREVAQLEQSARRALAAIGRAFLGPKRVLAQKPSARPAPGEPRRNLNPRIAARDQWKRREALSRLVGFLRAYRAARKAFVAGASDVLFPAGTYLLRVVQGVRCAAA